MSLLLTAAGWVGGGSAFAEPIAQAEPEQAQPAEEVKDDPAGPMTIELDLERLIFDAQASPVALKVWQLSAPAGRRILYLPFSVRDVDRVNALSKFPISVRTGRFIGFAIPEPSAPSAAADAFDLDALIDADTEALGELLFPTEDPNARIDGLGDSLAGDAADDSFDGDAPAVPDAAPRLAREIKLYPDGTIEWEMDRSFHAANVTAPSEQNPYPYKLDPETLRAIQPERAPRLTRQQGEDSRAFAERRRAQQLAEREAQAAYRDLRASLRDLPETFGQPRPAVLYAVLDVPVGDSLGLLGSSPFPWSLDDVNAQLFRTLAQGGVPLDTEQGQADYAKLVELAERHPLDARAIAIAAMRGRLAAKVETDDAGYRLLTKLIGSNDPATRRTALFAAARVAPPTLASARLIGVAGQSALGDERKMLSFNALGKLFSTQADEPEQVKRLVEQVNQVLVDPAGPGPARVVARVLQSVGRVGPPTEPATPTDAQSLIVEGILFEALSEQDAKQVVPLVVEAAPQNTVAAGWLDRKLLGSKDAKRIDLALSVLAEYDPAEPPAANNPADPAAASPAAIAKPTCRTIPIGRADHAIIGLLNSPIASQSDKAFATIDRFHLALPLAEPDASSDAVPDAATDTEPAVDPSVALLGEIVDQALARPSPAPAIVGFLERQRNPATGTAASERLVGLLIDPEIDAAVAHRAAESVIAYGGAYQSAISALDSRQKLALVARLYESRGQPVPLAAGLIAGSAAAQGWLFRLMQEAEALPTREDWAEEFARGGEAALLASASGQDAVVATGAAAALVTRVGGSVEQETAFASKVALMQTRTAELVQQAWVEAKQKIQASQFEKAEGTYRVIATIAKPAPLEDGGDEGQAPAADAQPTTLELGIAELRAEGTDLSLTVEAVALTPSPDRLGIRIVSLASLRAFNKTEIANLTLDTAAAPLDLTPNDDGSWSGETRLPDGKTLGLTLEPVR